MRNATSARGRGGGSCDRSVCVFASVVRVMQRRERDTHRDTRLGSASRCAEAARASGARPAACAQAKHEAHGERARSAPHTPTACPMAPTPPQRRDAVASGACCRARSDAATPAGCAATRVGAAKPGCGPCGLAAARTCGFQRLGAGARRHGAAAAQRARGARQRRSACGSTGDAAQGPGCQYRRAGARRRVPRPRPAWPRTGGGSDGHSGEHGGGHNAVRLCCARRFAPCRAGVPASARPQASQPPTATWDPRL
jgi:hypothetical protein